MHVSQRPYMRAASAGFAFALIALGPRLAPAATTQFDGAWQTTVSCDESHGGLGYSFRFISNVSNGVLHGQRGTIGKPSSLVLDGNVGPDGNATLYADGYVGSRMTTPGQEEERGTRYGYHVNAHFDRSTGSGNRVEGRHCGYEFVRQ
jgi:hypothetical protein